MVRIFLMSFWLRVLKTIGGVDAVEELGAELLLEVVEDLGLDLGVLFFEFLLFAGGLGAEAELDFAVHVGGADVTGHNDDRVAEVDAAALGVGDVAVFEDLQQHVEDVGVSLFELVEQDQAVGLAADLLGELATFVVADVTGGGADEAGDVVLFHELGHVDLDHGVAVVEQLLGQDAGELGLTDAGGSQEDEATDGAALVGDAGAGAADGAGDGFDGFVLADDAALEGLFELEQASTSVLMRRVAGCRS
jgi:hypothetical protein